MFLVRVSFWCFHALDSYIASPFTFNHSPIWVNLSSNMGSKRPSDLMPALMRTLPPQLYVNCNHK